MTLYQKQKPIRRTNYFPPQLTPDSIYIPRYSDILHHYSEQTRNNLITFALSEEQIWGGPHWCVRGQVLTSHRPQRKFRLVIHSHGYRWRLSAPCGVCLSQQKLAKLLGGGGEWGKRLEGREDKNVAILTKIKRSVAVINLRYCLSLFRHSRWHIMWETILFLLSTV